jgi:hypothetical protein
LSPYSFSICDTSSTEFEPYIRGGIAVQVKLPKNLSFQPLKAQLAVPSILAPDLAKFELPMQLHVVMLALDLFCGTHNRLPRSGNEDDASEMVQLAHKVVQQHGIQIENLNADLILKLSKTSVGRLPAFTAGLGGIVAQEVLIALTGR